VGALVDVRAEADSFEHRARAAPQLAAREAAGRPQPELDVLGRRERREQVVLLENEADAPAHALERTRVCVVQFLSQHPHATRLRGAQAPISVSSVVLPEPDGPVTMMISPAGIVADTSKRIWRRSAPLP
jgi:hypothetical protein